MVKCGVLLYVRAELINNIYMSLDFRGLMYPINWKFWEEQIRPLSLNKWFKVWDKNLWHLRPVHHFISFQKFHPS
jgi:hypothetical protein